MLVLSYNILQTVAYITQNVFIFFLEFRSSRSRYCQDWFILRPFSLACRWLRSCSEPTWSFLHVWVSIPVSFFFFSFFWDRVLLSSTGWQQLPEYKFMSHYAQPPDVSSCVQISSLTRIPVRLDKCSPQWPCVDVIISLKAVFPNRVILKYWD
jgi:hypothetical protein